MTLVVVVACLLAVAAISTPSVEGALSSPAAALEVQEAGTALLAETLGMVQNYGITLVGVVGLELLVIFVFLILFFITMKRNDRDNSERAALTQTLISMLESTTAAMISLKGEIEDLRRDTGTSFVQVATLFDKLTQLILDKSRESQDTHEHMRGEIAAVKAEVTKVQLELARLQGKKQGAAEAKQTTGAKVAAAAGG